MKMVSFQVRLSTPSANSEIHADLSVSVAGAKELAPKGRRSPRGIGSAVSKDSQLLQMFERNKDGILADVQFIREESDRRFVERCRSVFFVDRAVTAVNHAFD